MELKRSLETCTPIVCHWSAVCELDAAVKSIKAKPQKRPPSAQDHYNSALAVTTFQQRVAMANFSAINSNPPEGKFEESGEFVFKRNADGSFEAMWTAFPGLSATAATILDAASAVAKLAEDVAGTWPDAEPLLRPKFRADTEADGVAIQIANSFLKSTDT